MARAKKVMQLVVTTEDKAGMLEEVTAALAKEKVNIEAISAYGDENEAIFSLIVKNNQKAKKALSAKGWEVKEEEVVVIDLENQPGSLNKIASQCKKANVNLRYCYGAASGSGQASVVFKATDNDQLINAIK
jgi:hypothetical protein